MAMVTRDRSRTAVWLLILCYLLGAGALTLGLERESGHILAVALFAVACLGWWLAHRFLANSSKSASIVSFAPPVLWGANIFISAVLQIRAAIWDWFPLVSVCILGIAVLGAANSQRQQNRH